MKPLFNKYYPILVRRALAFVHDDLAAEDIVQEAFIKLWQAGIQNFGTEGEMVGYLNTVIRNTAFNHISHLKHVRKHRQEARWASIEEVMDIREFVLQKRAMELINDLSAQQQQVFRLCFFDGLTKKEVAENMGLAQATVRVQYKRAVDYIAGNFKGVEIGNKI